jgi:hypothetical protein
LRHAAAERLAPDLDLRHLRALTDDTGILQHARYTVPDRVHGYCTDDNARALAFALLAYEQTRRPELLDLARVYMSFLGHAYNRQTGRFRNFLSYDRRWCEEVGSDDAHGRAMSALGLAVAAAPTPGLRMTGLELFSRALRGGAELLSPRAIAETLIGIHAYLRRYSGDTAARRIRRELALRLFDMFRRHATDEWPWPEPLLAYANARLPHALLLAGQWLPRNDLIEMGLRSLNWLVWLQTGPHGEFAPVGNRGWYWRDGEKAHFDQQPIEAQTMIEACIQAGNLTADRRWTEEAQRCFQWFLGRNEVGQPLYDPLTGGCCDGLQPDGPNRNEGAESTLAWLMSWVALRAMEPRAMRKSAARSQEPGARTRREVKKAK